MKKNKLNMALLIMGISIVVLGAVLYFTAPIDLKDSFREIHSRNYTVERGDWNSPSGRENYSRFHNFDNYRSHGSIMFFPVLILGIVLITVYRKRYGNNSTRPGRPFNEKNPINTLQRVYAEGKITKEEYIERKKILEEEKEV